MFEVVHKGMTFKQSSKIPSRLLFAGGHCDVPVQAITGLRSDRSCILIEGGREVFRLVYKGPKDWLLSDITPQSAC